MKSLLYPKDEEYKQEHSYQMQGNLEYPTEQVLCLLFSATNGKLMRSVYWMKYVQYLIPHLVVVVGCRIFLSCGQRIIYFVRVLLNKILPELIFDSLLVSVIGESESL